VYVGEKVRVQMGAEMVLKTDDGGFVAVRPGGVFIAERFSATGRPSDHAVLRVLEGGLRIITGWIGRTRPADYRISTPTATIGIRGTDHEPYVMTESLAISLAQLQGTYDKVNRGGTVLDVGGNLLDVDPGKVGFARAPGTRKSRALMTLLLPVLLDKVPGFYVAGQFDAELDALSPLADQESMRQMKQRQSMAVAEEAPLDLATGGAVIMAPAPLTLTPVAPPASQASCAADAVARKWLVQLDSAVARRSASSLMQLFGPQVVVHATVRDAQGAATTVDFEREAFAHSTLDALQGLRDFKQRRLSISGQPLNAGDCQRIRVESLVLEQGKRLGQPYRFESIETYVLERQGKRWLAIEAQTVQR
jgi:hypothetical protein